MAIAGRTAAIILAAGKGTRLKTDLPKVLHEVGGRPMLAHVFDACRQAAVRDIIGVVGHGKDLVIDAFKSDRDIRWVEQSPQNGTGHAVMVCRDAFARQYDHVLVLGGDGPLIRAKTLMELQQRHVAENCSATLATAEIPDPTGYGRIIRDRAGNLQAIVEHNDCTPEQRQVREVNPSYYCFRVGDLLNVLERIQPNPKKGEYYITDAIALLIQAGKKVAAITSVPPEDIFSINTRQELAFVNGVFRERVLREVMEGGVTIIDPSNTWIDVRAKIGADTVIQPFTVIQGAATIGENCRIGPFAFVDERQPLAAGSKLARNACIGGSGGGA